MTTHRSSTGKRFSLELKHLRVLEAIFNEGSITRAAEALGMTQPALSRVLSSLRAYFDDPLFVRIGHRMGPTAKALELQSSVSDIVDRFTTLRTDFVPFDPTTSRRTFRFSVLDAGIVRIVPALLADVASSAPHVRFAISPLEHELLEAQLESGNLDFSMGSFPGVSKHVRSQPLWSARYYCAVRKDHPRITTSLSLRRLQTEQHVMVTASGTGHAHSQAMRAIIDVVSRDNILCTVPTFASAAMIARMTDTIVTLPAGMATTVAEYVGLKLFAPPVEMPSIQVRQYWHERFHREPGSQWIRKTFARLFGENC